MPPDDQSDADGDSHAEAVAEPQSDTPSDAHHPPVDTDFPTDVPTTAGSGLSDVIGALFGALNPDMVPAGRMVMIVSWDLGVSAISEKGSDNSPVFWDGNLSFGSYIPTANMGGLSIIVDPNMPANTYLLGMTSAATWYDTPGVPYTLQAVNVGQLGLDLAVYGYGALGVQYPGAFVKTTPT